MKLKLAIVSTLLTLASVMAAPFAAADHNTGHNVSGSVDTQLNSWIPTILALLFLGIGLGILFTAVNKMKGTK